MNKIYTETQLKEQGLIFFKGDSLATNVWISKYALKDKDGNYRELSPEDTVIRITKEIYRAESAHPNPLTYEEIYEVLKDFKYFIFGGSILYGLNNPYSVSTLGNCFFINNGADSYGGIFDTDQKMVQLMKRRGGVGITIEHLRPETASVNNAAQSSTGATSFMNRFSNSTREVAQDGRRGALMITMGLSPDVDKFVVIKDDAGKITGANISVKITDDFMKSVKNNSDYILKWPENLDLSNLDIPLIYNKLIKYNNGYIKKIKAKELWNIIIKQAHKNAEPGILFWDTIIKESPADCYANLGFKTEGTNPCISGDALIQTDRGMINIPEIINIIKFGNIIKAKTFNEITKDIEYKEILVAQKTKEDANIIEIETEDGDTLKLTPDHKVYTENRGWIEAAKLEKTDILLLLE